MRLSATLTNYLARQYLSWLLGVFLCFTSIALLFDTLELIRRTSGGQGPNLFIVVQMSLLKLPDLLQKTLPFIILFAGMATFWRLARANEAIVARAAGVSAWQFILPAVLISLVIGAFQISVVNPFSAAMLRKYEQFEALYLKRKTNTLAVSKSGLWLRQITDDRGYVIIHALRVVQERMELKDVIIFRFSKNNHFVERVDAVTMNLEDGFWRLPESWSSAPGRVTRPLRDRRIPTELTKTQILESFAPPESMSFWDLPEFIGILEAAGLPGHRHRLHFHSLLAYPFLLSSMILIAASFTLRINRRTRATYAIMAGLVCSFVMYFLTDVVHALGLSASIPVTLAAWTPAVVSVLLGLALLFHLEDG